MCVSVGKHSELLKAAAAERRWDVKSKVTAEFFFFPPPRRFWFCRKPQSAESSGLWPETLDFTCSPAELGVSVRPPAVRHEAETPAGVQLHAARQRLPGPLSAAHLRLLWKVRLNRNPGKQTQGDSTKAYKETAYVSWTAGNERRPSKGKQISRKVLEKCSS